MELAKGIGTSSQFFLFHQVAFLNLRDSLSVDFIRIHNFWIYKGETP